ncbi:MAG: TIR domain-containing protein, partial [Nitrospirota bacterium]
MSITVFISHSSKDKPAVLLLAEALRQNGIDVWLDKWEIGPGDDIVTKINEGLEKATAGLIVFSPHSQASRWVEAEISYLTYARIQEGKLLIPIKVEDDAWIPPLLRPLAWRKVNEVEAIIDALHHRTPGSPPLKKPSDGRLEQVVIVLERVEANGIRVTVQINQQEYASKIFATLPKDVEKGRNAFLQGCHGLYPRTSETASRATQEHQLLELGRHLRPFCLPDNARQALASLLQGCPTGTMVEVGFEADEPDLLGLPFEVLRLDNDQLLATHPSVVILRRLRGMAEHTSPPLPGPLKILVAVGAPDEGQSSGAVLDQERELQNILDATDQAQRQENVQVRILEVGHPDVIASSIERDAYHILHLSCHGLPGQLELEDEEGRAFLTTAETLLEPIRATGRPLPMVFLSTCHGGVVAEETASFAMDLLRGGVPCVLAMQTSVSDYYATQLARSFYEHLSRRELLLPSRALAQARKELEHTRVQAIQKGAP